MASLGDAQLAHAAAMFAAVVVSHARDVARRPSAEGCLATENGCESVSVEAGLGLDQGIRKVADEMRNSYRVLSDELQLSTLHLQMGRVRASVLQELGNRTGVEDLRTLASLLIQADKFGSGVAQALRVQSEAMRIKRQQIAEEKAAKTAVKLIFPLVIFIFPGVFVVLVGPAAIQMAREMFPAMEGK